MKDNVFASHAYRQAGEAPAGRSLPTGQAGFSEGWKQSRRKPNGIASSSSPVPAETPRNDAVVFSDLLRREELMDHMKHPRNRGDFPDADRVRTEQNPLCGDEVTVYVKLTTEGEGSEPRIREVRHWGHGCMISQASASILSEHVVGKSAFDLNAMERADVEELLGGMLSPARVKCAMLPLIALRHGLTIKTL